jgi:CubicO group peptidase (beta-lactamase class C family)
MKILRTFLIIALSMLIAAPLLAQSQTGEAERLAAYVDAKLQPLINKKQIPGAVVAVVQTGKPTLFRGYGFANIAAKRAMDPQKTRVRVGSISKSFTALALLQLVDEGKVRLNEDANKFLKTERFPSRYGQSITVLDLLTHRAGFDGDISYVAVNQGQSTAITQGWLSRQMMRVSPSGRFAYDNTAYAALGQIIAAQDGISYEQAVKRRVYDRLGMTSAMMGVDPKSLDFATCYQRLRRLFEACTHQVLKDTYGAAGNMSVTAADMALYLQALIDGGGKLLSPATFAAFSNTKYRLHPMGAGDGLGVYEMGPKGSGVFGHSGGIRGGSSTYFVIPSKGIGLFVHINSSDGGDNIFNLSGMVSAATSSTSSDDGFDPGELMSLKFPTDLGARFGNVPAPTTYTGTCDETQLPGQYQYSRALGFAALAPRLLGRMALPPLDVVKGAGDAWMIDGKPYRRTANCLFTSTGKSFLDGEIAGTVGFAVLPDGTVMGGPHALAGWTKLVWHESASVTALPYLAALLLLPFGFVAAWGADSKTRRAFRITALSGSVLFGCILLEMEYASDLVQNQGRLFPAILWRAGWHVALVGLLWGVFALAQALRLPEASKWRKGVVVLFAVASITAIILSAYWGLIGTFTGNNFS